MFVLTPKELGDYDSILIIIRQDPHN